MDLDQIENIIDLIAESDVDEVAIEEGEFKIKVKKTADVEQQQSAAPVQYQVPQQPAPQPQTQAQSSAQPQQADNSGSDSSSDGDQTEQASGDVAKSPIVGTFYRAPSPDDDPFVSVGDSVDEGQTLCIVEAMKIMNEIESEHAGEVKEILVEDGEAVEFEQPLFIIG